MKVIIEDHAKRLSSDPAEKETELPKESTIRFEAGKNRFIVSIVGEGVKIHKMSDTFDESILIEPIATNQVILK